MHDNRAWPSEDCGRSSPRLLIMQLINAYTSHGQRYLTRTRYQAIINFGRRYTILSINSDFSLDDSCPSILQFMSQPPAETAPAETQPLVQSKPKRERTTFMSLPRQLCQRILIEGFTSHFRFPTWKESRYVTSHVENYLDEYQLVKQKLHRKYGEEPRGWPELTARTNHVNPQQHIIILNYHKSVLILSPFDCWTILKR